MLGIEELPIEKKLAIRYMIIALGIFIGGFLWLWGLGNIHDTSNHSKVAETENELMFRNF